MDRLTFATCGLLFACGEAQSVSMDEMHELTAQSEWRLVEQEYPYVSDDGVDICARYERPGPHGYTMVDFESYYFNRMNEQLDDARAAGGTKTLPLKAVTDLRNKGVERVATCEAAREFTRLKTEARALQDAQSPPKGGAIRELSSPRPTDDASSLSDRVDKIKTGATWTDSRVVFFIRWLDATHLSMCTGQVFANRGVISSAHCAPGGYFKAVILASGGTCLTTGNCFPTQPTADNIAYYSHFQYTGLGDVGDDIGMAVSWYDWNGSPGKFRLMTSGPYNGTQVWLAGYGADNNSGTNWGTLRLSNSDQSIDGSNSTYVRLDFEANQGQGCKGDSGGPLINTNLHTSDLSLGIYSEAEIDSPGDACPTSGAMRHTRHKSSWITDKLLAGTGATCTSFSGGGGTFSYLKCF